jgi:hypothetical protein
MKSTKLLRLEINKLNQKLDEISMNGSKFLIYSANPWKFAWYNFLAGIFHSLGSLVGTAVIAAGLIYFFSKVDLVNTVSVLVETVLNRIQWQNILIPTPTP